MDVNWELIVQESFKNEDESIAEIGQPFYSIQAQGKVPQATASATHFLKVLRGKPPSK